MRRRLVAIFAAVLVSTVAGAWALPAASAHTDPWAKFCGVAQRIRTTKLFAYAPGKWGNPKLPHLHHDLIVAAPKARSVRLSASPIHASSLRSAARRGLGCSRRSGR